jgi:hypothetical protein
MPNQFDQTFIFYFIAKMRHQQIVINLVKELRQIDIYRNAATFLDNALHLLYRLLNITPRTEPETIVRESRVEDRR